MHASVMQCVLCVFLFYSCMSSVKKIYPGAGFKQVVIMWYTYMLYVKRKIPVISHVKLAF